MLGRGFESLAVIIDSFLEDAPKLMAELSRSIESNDISGARRAAHSLKSNGTDFGSAQFSDLCKEMEASARSGTLTGAKELYESILGEYKRLEAELKDIRQKGTFGN